MRFVMTAIELKGHALTMSRLNESLRIRLVSSWWDEANVDHAATDCLTACPSCGAPMRFLRTVPRLRGLPELQTFECRPCGLAVTAEQVLQFPKLLLPLSA
jgi:transposase-like protein